MEKNNSTSTGILFAIVGVVLFSAKAVMVKLAYDYHIDSVSLLLFRMIFALPFYILIAIWKKPQKPQHIKKKDYLWVFLFGFLGYYLASFFDFEGLWFIKAGLERIILFIYPTIVVILSWIFFRKKLSKKQLIAIFITYIGVIITFWNEIDTNSNNVFWGAFLIFLSAFTYASYLVGSGWLIPKFGVIPFTAYSMMVSTFCVFIHYSIVRDFDLFNYEMPVYVLGFCMAFFSTLIPSFLVSEAINRLGASVFSIVGSLGPVSTIILAYFFLEEEISFIQSLGMLVVISGVYFVSRKKNK
ncbi:DMT family transporter [Aquimarina agarivorans]|uniref:DMT family transporter n=1 Tax=Aquimarina agarivorans TaxID=980584 RepID=UPI000248EA84|nr:DMT family transporter [Aquimarina agarivorans]